VSATTTNDGLQQHGWADHYHRPVQRVAARYFIRLLLGALLATLMPLATMGAASAAPAPAGHSFGGHGHHPGGGGGGGQPGGGGGGQPGPGLGRHHGRRVSLSGTAQDVTASGFELTQTRLPSPLTSTSTTVTPASTTIDVSVTANTRFIEPGQHNAGISGVADGDTVQVIGAPAGTGTVTALSVDVPLAQYTGVAGPATSGFTLSSSPRGRELTGTSTTIAVGVTSGTVYREPGQSSPGPSGVVNGDTVYVTGVQAGTKAVTATVVVVQLAEATGTVSLLSTTGFTLTTAKGGTVAVDLSTSTKVKQRGVSSPVVQNGDTVEVIGTQAGQATVDALVVTIGTGRHGHNFGPGPVGPPHPGGGNSGHQGRG